MYLMGARGAKRILVVEDNSLTRASLLIVLSEQGYEIEGAYRAASQDNRIYGLPEQELSRLFRRAAALINLTGATLLREEHLQVPVRIYLETDPVLPQIEVAQGRKVTLDLLDAHTHHFTFGENIGRPDCGVPVERYRYRPTRQPVVLDWWASPADAPARRPGRSRPSPAGSSRAKTSIGTARRITGASTENF